MGLGVGLVLTRGLLRRVGVEEEEEEAAGEEVLEGWEAEEGAGEGAEGVVAVEEAVVAVSRCVDGRVNDECCIRLSYAFIPRSYTS